MIYLKWFLIFGFYRIVAVLYLILLVPIWYSLFTRNNWPKWGKIFQTYDNPPWGDEGYRAKRAPFPFEGEPISRFKAYINRVVWMYRNPLYGFKKEYGIDYDPILKKHIKGDPGISDKYKRPGYYRVDLTRGSKLIGFELYWIKPWSENRCIRARLGWKIDTDKFERYGFAQFVATFNIFDSYGDS